MVGAVGTVGTAMMMEKLLIQPLPLLPLPLPLPLLAPAIPAYQPVRLIVGQVFLRPLFLTPLRLPGHRELGLAKVRGLKTRKPRSTHQSAWPIPVKCRRPCKTRWLRRRTMQITPIQESVLLPTPV